MSDDCYDSCINDDCYDSCIDCYIVIIKSPYSYHHHHHHHQHKFGKKFISNLESTISLAEHCCCCCLLTLIELLLL